MADLNNLITPFFLNDKEIRKIIELIFFSYRDFTAGPDKILEKLNFGRAHHRVIYFVGKKDKITIKELLGVLKITKQSLNRVLRDLIKSKMIKQVRDENDTRKKNLFLDKEGKIFFDTVYNVQKKRIFNALKNSNADSVIKFKEVLKKIVNEK